MEEPDPWTDQGEEAGKPLPDDLADGWWCHSCQFFEVDDPNQGTRCNACGCPAGDHLEAKVVAA